MILVAACANIGSPDGGMYDETPPRVVTSTPLNGSVGNTAKKVSILFDEYIKIENASEKVVVSPPQTEVPAITTEGKKVKITLYDTLKANTTYTIDFADAIVDNNEGNPMGNYTFSFSTGTEIDTMEFGGYVLNAQDLEPIKGILVGLYRVHDEEGDSIVPDSVLRTRPFDRVSRTNGSGYFVIKGVAQGKRYRAFALKDMDNDFMFSQKSEMLAADTAYYMPSCGPDYRLDTIWSDSTHYDSIVPVRFIHHYPDDIVLRAFLEEGQDRHLLKTQRDQPESFTVFFTAPSDSMPTIQGISFQGDGGFVCEASAGLDTITYWIPDTTIAYADTLTFAYRYMDTDTTHRQVWKTDTLEITPKLTRAKQVKQRNEQIEEWEKDYKKRQKKQKNLPPEVCPYLTTPLTIELKPNGNIDPNQYPIFTFSEPVLEIDTTHLHLQQKQDSLLVPCPYVLVPLADDDSTTYVPTRRYQLFAAWQMETQYVVSIDSAALQGVLHHTNQPFKQELRLRKEDEYGALFITPIVGDTNVIVELLNTGGKVVRSERAKVKNGKNASADFFYLSPADYYLRAFIDKNEDGVWTTGDYDAGIAPEEVFYFPKAITLKAGWQVDQEWDLRGIPVMKQKPDRLIKQKADKEKKIKNRNKEREAKWGKPKKG